MSAVLAEPRAAVPARGDLDWLESGAIYTLREVAGQCQNPVLLFSGGKDSAVLLRLAEKGFRPGRFPFPLLHGDTGHNFADVIALRDGGGADGEKGSRNAAQSVTLLEAIGEFGFDAAIGGARRDEEKARAKERI